MKKSEQLIAHLNDIASKVTGDNADEVKSLIGKATTLAGEMGTALSTFAQENETYRKSARETAAKIKAAETKIKNLEDDLEAASGNEFEEELNTLREFKANTLKTMKDNFISRFQTVSGHKNFELAKSQFKLPEPNDKGEYDFSELSDSDLEYNVEAMTRLDSLQYFGETQKRDSHGRTTETGGGKDFTELVKEAKTEQELMEIAQGLS